MRKRLRKKKRLGDFAEYGFVITLKPESQSTDSERETLLDRFIDEAIERNDLSCGGGGGETMEFFVTANGHRASVTHAQRDAVELWLSAAGGIASFSVGPPVDAWHGDV